MLITTKEPVDMFNITYDVQHWVSWIDDLNSACSGYSGTVQGNTVTARSMNLEDVNKAVEYTEPELPTFRFGTVYDTTNRKLNYYYPSSNPDSHFNSMCKTNALGGQSGNIWRDTAKLRPVVSLPSNIRVQEENGIYDIK